MIHIDVLLFLYALEDPISIMMIGMDVVWFVEDWSVWVLQDRRHNNELTAGDLSKLHIKLHRKHFTCRTS